MATVGGESASAALARRQGTATPKSSRWPVARRAALLAQRGHPEPPTTAGKGALGAPSGCLSSILETFRSRSRRRHGRLEPLFRKEATCSGVF